MGNTSQSLKRWISALLIAAAAVGLILWKIGGAPAGEAGVSETVHHYFTKVQNRDLRSSYQQLTARDFQQAVPFSDYRSYLEQYPILFRFNSVTIEREAESADSATARALLSSPLGDHHVDFYLVKEKGDWKIWNMQLTVPSPYFQQIAAADGEKPMSIAKIVVGTRVNERGEVVNGSETLPSETDQIFINVFLNGASKGADLKLLLTYLETGQGLIPLSTTIPEEGEAVVSFAYSGPVQGWPPGEYEIEVSVSSGIKSFHRFTIE